MEDVKNDKSAIQMNVHDGVAGQNLPAHSGYGVKGMRSVADGATRSDVAPNPKSLGGRTA